MYSMWVPTYCKIKLLCGVVTRGPPVLLLVPWPYVLCPTFSLNWLLASVQWIRSIYSIMSRFGSQKSNMNHNWFRLVLTLPKWKSWVKSVKKILNSTDSPTVVCSLFYPSHLSSPPLSQSHLKHLLLQDTSPFKQTQACTNFTSFVFLWLFSIWTAKQQSGPKCWRKTEKSRGMHEKQGGRERDGEGGRDRPSFGREKVRSHAAGMLEGGIAGVTAPFFTAVIRASCQWEGPEDEEGEGGGLGGGWRMKERRSGSWERSFFGRSQKERRQIESIS